MVQLQPVTTGCSQPKLKCCSRQPQLVFYLSGVQLQPKVQLFPVGVQLSPSFFPVPATGPSITTTSFQTMMNEILKDLINQGHVVCYMDNILIFTKDLESHHLIVKEVLKHLQDNNLFCKPQKCSFKQSQIKYLGMIINEQGVHMDPKKVEGVLNWPEPKNIKPSWASQTSTDSSSRTSSKLPPLFTVLPRRIKPGNGLPLTLKLSIIQKISLHPNLSFIFPITTRK